MKKDRDLQKRARAFGKELASQRRVRMYGMPDAGSRIANFRRRTS